MNGTVNIRNSLPSSFKHLSFITWLFFWGYLFLLFFFDKVDVYHYHFYRSGYLISLYNFCRFTFIIYLLWLFYIVGNWTLLFIFPKTENTTLKIESLLRDFFAGISAWQIGLFVIGLLGLYYRLLMATFTLILLFLSLPKFDKFLKSILLQISYRDAIGFILFSIPLIYFLMIKGLYPAGGHDYYTHYFLFYKKVIDLHSILPNAVWYQFYYSKGAGLFFLSMLLTDPLGPQLASTAMVFAGAGLVYSILNYKSTWHLFPWIGASLYIALLIYTPGPLENMHLGGWGDLEKPHEPAAVLVLAILWMSIQLLRTSAHQSILGFTLILVICALTIISQPMAIFAEAYLIALVPFYVFWKRKNAAKWLGYAILSLNLTLFFVFALNYFLTGLIQDQSSFFFENFVNFEKIKKWGVLLEFLILHWMKTNLIANKIPLSTDFFFRALTYLRLDVWWLLCTISLITTALALCFKNWRQSLLAKLDHQALLATAIFLVVVIALSTMIGRDQTASFYRFTTFNYGPMLVLCLLLLSAAIPRWTIGMTLFIIFGLATFLWFSKLDVFLSKINPTIQSKIQMVVGNYHFNNYQIMAKNAKKFIAGKYSLAEAYTHQAGWPGRMPWGGINPASEKIWRLLSRKTRIWSMHIHSYCMLPDCDMESYFSFRLSRQEQIIYFGEPMKAKEILQKEKLNYFFYSDALQLTDPLPLSPLFSPKNIATYFGILWTDGHNTLLTWKENTNIPISSQWIDQYAQQVATSAIVNTFPYAAIRKSLESANKKNFRLSEVPWHRF